MASRYALAALFAVVLVAGAPTDAPAQCRLCSAPTTQPEGDEAATPLRLDVEATLDFDRLVLLGPGDGAATLLPNGDRAASGNVATLSARAMVGSVTVHGEPGRTVRIDMPSRIDLHSASGGRVAIEQVESDLPSIPKLDPSGRLTFQFGGRLKVQGDADGEYRGDIPITVEYL